MRSLWKRLLTGMLVLVLMVTGLPMRQVSAAENPTNEEDEYLLNYLVIEKPYIETPDIQKIVVSIGGEDAVYLNPVLVYRNQDTNEVFECAADQTDGNAALFTISHGQEEEAVYVLTEVWFEAEGRERSISFVECGLAAQYGVNTEADSSNADAVIIEDGEKNLDITATDMEGNVISSGSFGTVLEQARRDVATVSDAMSAQAEVGQEETHKSALVVVIDPGHDRTHSGADYFGVNEQQLTLKIAKYCKTELETYKNVEVYLTRETEACAWGKTDLSTCLINRTKFAEEKETDIFISIHLNADDGTGKAFGAEVYYPNPNYRPDLSEEGSGLAEAILKKLGELGITERGIQYQYVSDDDPKYNLPDGSRGDKYAVIRECKKRGIPALIVEHAFLSNSGDYNNFLNSDAKLQKLGIADATAIAEYYGLERGIVTVYDGVDYSPVYDYEYYMERYEDLKRAFGDDPEGALRHFVNFGMAEGRRASAGFDVDSYRNQYQDLRRAFGKNWKSYYLHYITNGKWEGRITTGVTELQNGVTLYNGVDYSAVYDFNYYTHRYSDIEQIYGDDEYGALGHFVVFGMQEGRQGSEEFNVDSYRNQYQDLRRAFGKNWKSYYLHYITNGKWEGRITTGVTELQNGVTSYNGLDYSDVYNFNYYIHRYSDIGQIYGDDEYGALNHFVVFGMKEGRQAKEDFNVEYYRNNYSDLERAFGDNLVSYYLHYITNGKWEGREASKEFYCSIMGTSGTTIEKMASYYKDRYTYPVFYAKTEAPTIEDFCRIYMEECIAEGVRTEVAFCQSMKETGFLQYPGVSCVVKPEQFNFAGLDTTGEIYPDGTVEAGRSYPDVRTGIRAHIQRLKAYAVKGITPDSFAYECVDPDKFDSQWWTSTIVGCAPYVEWLGKEQNPSGFGWATDPNYGYSIKKDYLAKLLSY